MNKGFTLVQVLTALALAVMIAMFFCGCARVEQKFKYMQGEFTGIPRTVELYSYDGQKLKEYSGTQTLLDFKENHVVVLVDGKRVTASNVIVVSEER
jgi:hypothetical protein